MSVTDPTATIRTAADAAFVAATLLRETALGCPGSTMRDPVGIWRDYAEMPPWRACLYAVARRVRGRD